MSAEFLHAKPKLVSLSDGGAESKDGQLEVVWNDGSLSSFSADWLLKHSLEPEDQLSRRTAEVAEIRGHSRATFAQHEPFDFRKIMDGGSNETLAFIDRLWQYGLVL